MTIEAFDFKVLFPADTKTGKPPAIDRAAAHARCDATSDNADADSDIRSFAAMQHRVRFKLPMFVWLAWRPHN